MATPVSNTPIFSPEKSHGQRSQTRYSPWGCKVQFSSVAQSCLTLCNPMDCGMPGFPVSINNSRSLLKLMSIELVMPSNHLILCHALLLLPSIFPSIRVFSTESLLCILWPKYCSFSFSISPSNEYSGLISFRIWSPCCPRDSLESSPTPSLQRVRHNWSDWACTQSHFDKSYFIWRGNKGN